MTTTLVTGGGGFIGSNLVHALLARGHAVRVLDNFATGREENLTEVRDRIALHRADLRDAAAVARAVEGCDFVLHEAALPSVVHSVSDPVLTHDVNLNGTLTLLEAARAARVKRLVFAGSSAVYGNSEVLPKVETMPPEPLSPYALHKIAAETYGRLYTSLYGLEVVTLRYFNVFGPRQDPKSDYAAVIPRFVAMMSQGQAPTIFGDGGQTRDFCHIDNVIEANVLACTAPSAPGRTYNVACGERISLLDLVDRINGILGTSVVAAHAPERVGDVRHSVADIAAAQRDLGYVGGVNFTEGLRRTIAWYLGGSR